MLLFVFIFASSVTADLVKKTASIDDVSITYKIPCTASPAQLNLGDLTITLEDNGGSSCMNAQFSVDVNARGNTIWSCMELHWLQTIWHDDCPAKISGKNPTLPIIDPPKDGWDYMYNDGAGRTNPNLTIPNYGWFIDDKPWYYNSTGEAAKYVKGQTYSINDCPGDCTAPGWTGFSTYLMAVATQTCPNQPPECLGSGEMLLLCGFDWTVSATDISISDTFTAPSPFDVTDITTSLGNASFEGWTVRDSDMICCIPEPTTMGMIVISGLMMIRCRRK